MAMSTDVSIEYYNGQTAVFANARYGVRGNKFVITRKGKRSVEIERTYVYDVQLLNSGGLVSASYRPGSAMRGTTR
jgi:hypothetical protein